MVVKWCRDITIVLAVIGGWYSLTGSPWTRQMLLTASVLSALWVYWYGYDYRSDDQVRIESFNVTTWVCWTLGLMAVGLFFTGIDESLTLFQRMALTGILWVISIVMIEWIGYNKMGIKLKSDYPGLCGMELMHGPWYLKLYYLSVWVLFLAMLGKLS